jgi:2-polyprenyl-6-methoxyphenol hydroxylase-like FAD-dependent oxidoreductase
MVQAHTEILVIGAGPAGLFAASELLRHGVRPRVVRRLAPHNEAGGTALQPALLEMLDRDGLIEPSLRPTPHHRLRGARRSDLVSIVDAADARFDATEAGVPAGGAILVRPDGFIGFRAAPADASCDLAGHAATEFSSCIHEGRTEL